MCDKWRTRLIYVADFHIKGLLQANVSQLWNVGAFFRL